jgi:ribosomal protein L11 methylase PrmA
MGQVEARLFFALCAWLSGGALGSTRRIGLPKTTASQIRWFHDMGMPDGEVSKSTKPASVLLQQADIVFRDGVVGKSVLDIGAWDGFFSFEAEKRGAATVLATDYFCWGLPSPRSVASLK